MVECTPLTPKSTVREYYLVLLQTLVANPTQCAAGLLSNITYRTPHRIKTKYLGLCISQGGAKCGGLLRPPTPT